MLGFGNKTLITDLLDWIWHKSVKSTTVFAQAYTYKFYHEKISFAGDRKRERGCSRGREEEVPPVHEQERRIQSPTRLCPLKTITKACVYSRPNTC